MKWIPNQIMLRNPFQNILDLTIDGKFLQNSQETRCVPCFKTL